MNKEERQKIMQSVLKKMKDGCSDVQKINQESIFIKSQFLRRDRVWKKPYHYF